MNNDQMPKNTSSLASQPAEVINLAEVGKQSGNDGAAAPASPPTAQPVAPAEGGSSSDDSIWIDAARQVIATTRDNPFLQAEQLYALRLKYMKQIHGQDLKPKESET